MTAIGLSLGTSVYSAAIRAAQRTVGLRWQAVTHVYITHAGRIREAIARRGVIDRPHSELERDHPYIEVPVMDQALGWRLWQAAFRYVGRSYDSSAAFRAPWKRTGLLVDDEDTSERLFCSELLAQCAEDVLGAKCTRVQHPEAVLPAHVADWPILDWGSALFLAPLPPHGAIAEWTL